MQIYPNPIGFKILIFTLSEIRTGTKILITPFQRWEMQTSSPPHPISMPVKTYINESTVKKIKYCHLFINKSQLN
jgi:hypothetical protein